jgi:gas vesicle protein
MDELDEKQVVVIERSEGGLGGFLLGLAVGAAVAVLFAPRSGEETRRELRNQGRRLRASATEKAEDLQEMLGGSYEDTRSRVEDGIQRAREVIDEKRTDANDVVDAGKAAVGSAREELERRLSTARKTRSRARAKTESDDDE